MANFSLNMRFAKLSRPEAAISEPFRMLRLAGHRHIMFVGVYDVAILARVGPWIISVQLKCCITLWSEAASVSGLNDLKLIKSDLFSCLICPHRAGLSILATKKPFGPGDLVGGEVASSAISMRVELIDCKIRSQRNRHRHRRKHLNQSPFGGQVGVLEWIGTPGQEDHVDATLSDNIEHQCELTIENRKQE